MSRKNWSVHFVAGNPDIRSKVRTNPESPMLRSKALDAAKVLANKGWQVWVSNDAGEWIYESPTEKTSKPLNPTQRHSLNRSGAFPTNHLPGDHAFNLWVIEFWVEPVSVFDQP